jgi:YD repeat-containing protein
MDRVKTRKDALNRTESYEYDKNGNLTKFTDRKNQVATFTYDGLNRRTGATYTDATVTYSYDAIDRPTATNDSVGGNISWVYDTVNSGHHPRVAETTSHGKKGDRLLFRRGLSRAATLPERGFNARKRGTGDFSDPRGG